MKKNILILTTLIFSLILPACGNSTPDENELVVSNEIREFVLAPEVELIIGTVRLEETDIAISASQASELLPLWKALRSLSNSETAAVAEVEAIINQILDAMTKDQMIAIKKMALTMQDLNALAETLGIEGVGFGRGNLDPETQATIQAARESGEARPQGLGGQGLGGGQGSGRADGLDPAARETAIAERGGSRGANLALNDNFLDAIIKFIEEKIN